MERNPELISDAKILLESQQLNMEKIELDRSIGLVFFLPVSDFVFSHVKTLVKPGATKVELNAGMARFRAYVRGEQNKLPLVDGFTSYMLAQMKYLADNRMRGFWPSRQEVENYLKNSDQTLIELNKLLSRWPGDEWKRDFEEFKLQESGYREFLTRKVLPYTRKLSTNHPKNYAHLLKESGIYKTPAELIELGETDYEKTYKEFKVLAKKVALKLNLPDSNPRKVIEYLKSKKFTDDQTVLNSYNLESDNLMAIIKDHGLISIKEKPSYEVRFGSQAEMNSMPSPHFIPEPLNSKAKVRGQFVIPRSSGASGTDDFMYREAIVTLVAHEAIPGHALQHEIMRERGSSLMRTWIASNSANLEGWALYAESIVYPFMNEEEKFVFLQRRLWRIARTFLDPQINLGKISRARVIEVFVKELGFSEPFAQTEFERYSYIIPGQAPSYYYGYSSLLDTKKQIKEKLKDSFNEKCFNDGLLDLGPLPLSEINSRLVKDLNCDGE